MSNTLTSNPLILDTAAAGVIITQSFLITKVVWDNTGGDIAPGDQAILHDKNSNIKYKQTLHDTGTAANVFAQPLIQDFPRGLPMEGLICPTLTHGMLYVYYEGPCPLKTT